MNHPERDAWVPYLFRESSAEETARLDAHLAECAACRGQIEGWRGSLGRLDAWRIPASRRDPVAGGAAGAVAMAAILRWAAVVVVSALVGAAGGGWAVRRAMEPGVPSAGFTGIESMPSMGSGNGSSTDPVSRGGVGEAALAGDVARLRESVEQLRDQQEARFFELRRDLETVALTTEAALRQTRRGLIEVAGYRRSVESP